MFNSPVCDVVITTVAVETGQLQNPAVNATLITQWIRNPSSGGWLQRGGVHVIQEMKKDQVKIAPFFLSNIWFTFWLGFRKEAMLVFIFYTCSHILWAFFCVFTDTGCFLIRFTINRHRLHFSVLYLYTCTVIKYSFVGLSHGSKISRGPKKCFCFGLKKKHN